MVNDVSQIASEIKPQQIIDHCRNLLGIPQLSWNSLNDLNHEPIQMSDIERDQWSKMLLESSPELKLDTSCNANTPPHLYHELEMFKNMTDYNTESYPPVFQNLDRTYLSVGQFALKKMINHPTRDTDYLETLQKRVRHLSKLNVEKIHKDFQQLKEFESDVYWFWKPRDEETNRYLHQLYFDHPILSKCNQSETILNWCSFYKIIYSPSMMVLSPIICLISPFIISRYILKVNISFKEYRESILGRMVGNTGVIRFVGNKKKYIIWVQYLSIFFWMFSYFQGVYNSVCLAKNTYYIHQSIHEHVSKLARFLAKSDEMYQEYHHLFEDKLLESQYKPFPTLLKCSLYKNPDCVWNNKGKLLVDFLSVSKNRDTTHPLFNFLGNLDALLNIHTLVSTPDYNFAKYKKDAKTPSIEIEKLWHPSFKPESMIRNDFKLGVSSKYPRNALITGPNAGGKSTFLKSLSIAVLLSQTIGIAPSSKIVLTPFSLINTYLNIPDCKGQESLFEAEMNRAYNHLQMVQDLSSNHFSFCILDEIFNGTNPNEGISGAYAIANQLGKMPHSISLITTHFHQLQVLGNKKSTTTQEALTESDLSQNDTQQRSESSEPLESPPTPLPETNYRNYQIPVKINKDQIKYLYQIQDGVSEQLIALKLLAKKGFHSGLVQQAEKICGDLVESGKIH